MGKLTVFNFLTLNGYYKGPNGDISWHNKQGAEEHEFAVASMSSGNSTLLFGRITYEMMAGYWPSQFAADNDPEMAEGINNAEKIVFSTTLKGASWKNTKLVKDNIVNHVRNLKTAGAKNMTVLGSGSIVTQFAENGLVDEYQFMIDPVAIGNGTPVLEGISQQLDLELIATRTFKSGVVLLCYRPAETH